MATLLLNLRNVPEDEAREVRELLTEAGVGYYETPPNRWFISMGGIWARAEEAEHARELVADYQRRRGEAARQAHAELRAAGDGPTFIHRLRERPLEVFARLVLAMVLIGITLWPFLALIEYGS